ncbi:MAG: hypothetical protein LBS85_03800, partial [Clostridiales Family XIII bacterium]|nr:hypothetical protein [Clostridiales Family XIII bacterium]
EDIDSTPDDDPDNDGPVKDNVVGEDHKTNPDGDEDDSDTSTISIEAAAPFLSVETDKDTIKRTSAAYVSLPDKEGFYNVGNPEEHYRYDINFRSLSNIEADEFVVDDPLEAVGKLGQVRVEGLWTPSVWGDKDGRLNVWYKTNKGDASAAAVDTERTPVTTSSVRVFPNTGWRLWKHIDQSAALDQNGGVIKRVELGLPAGLAEGEYITAIRFEYGAVKVGFTSKNYDGTTMNLDYRNSNGVTDYIKNGTIEGATPASAGKSVGALARQEAIAAFPVSATALANAAGQLTGLFGISPLDAYDPVVKHVKGSTGDWTPDRGESFYPVDSGEAAQLAAATLKPATYLVSASRAMSAEDIVSSVSANIAGRIGGATVYDQDRDAVLTRELQTFGTEPGGENPGASVEENSFLEHAKAQGLTYRDGEWYTPDGRKVSTVRTGDPMAVSLWIVMAILALASLVLLNRIRRRPQNKAAAAKGGELK